MKKPTREDIHRILLPRGHYKTTAYMSFDYLVAMYEAMGCEHPLLTEMKQLAGTEVMARKGISNVLKPARVTYAP